MCERNAAPWGRGRSLHVDKARRLYYKHLTEIARGDASHITHLADCVHTIASCPHMFLFVQQQQTIVITLSYQWSYLSSYRRPNLSPKASSAFVGSCWLFSCRPVSKSDELSRLSKYPTYWVVPTIKKLCSKLKGILAYENTRLTWGETSSVETGEIGN